MILQSNQEAWTIGEQNGINNEILRHDGHDKSCPYDFIKYN
jgi:hypothetical protein